ncbi:MAG: glycosyltransferase family 2 protein [Flavobacteriaceae bacterium]|nr:glycosyltransferase family 2 protein [Flavobacteriaceae bacterium]
MPNPARVSILMPFKDTAAFLPACLDSVLAQEYQHWELLAVDDHSEDSSAAIVANYVEKDERIQLLQNLGEGIIHALRTAYSKSEGSLITRMDSDDLMPANKLLYMQGLLSAKGPGHLATGQVRYFSSRGISNGYARYEKWLNRLTASGSNFEEIYKECAIPSPCWMVFRQDLDACGAFKEDRYPEDYDLTFRFYRENLVCIPCNKVLHHWRDYDTRTSRTDPKYAMNYFLEIKTHYFLELDRQPARALAVWGAGQKGKKVARLLKKRGIPFYWLCDNPKKIGKRIYGIPLKHYKYLRELGNPQSIITVANSKAQSEIRSFLSGLQQESMRDYYFFC